MSLPLIEVLPDKPITDRAELIAKIIEIITKTENWDQSVWVHSDKESGITVSLPELKTPTYCGTSCCVAGWATILSGVSVRTSEEPWDLDVFIPVRAAAALGLDDENADYLFAFYRTKDEVLEFLEDLLRKEQSA